MPVCDLAGKISIPCKKECCFAGFLALAVVLGLIIRLIALYLEPCISNDGVIYIDLVRHWMKTGRYIRGHAYLPLLPFLMKQLVHAGMSIFAAGIAVSIVSGGVVIAFCGLLIRQATGSREFGIAAALLAAVHPELVELSFKIQRDSIYLAFAAISLWAFLKFYLDGKLSALCIAGAAAGCGIFCRYEMLELPLLFGLLQLGFLIRKREPLRQILLQTALFAGVFLLTLFLVGWMMGMLPELWTMYVAKVHTLVKGSPQ